MEMEIIRRSIALFAFGIIFLAAGMTASLSPAVAMADTQQSTAVSIFEANAPQSQSAQTSTPASGLAPLINADNLERVFYFDNSTKTWLFFDPRPAFAAANSLKELRDRQIYWLKIRRDQTVTLNGKGQPLNCINEGMASENCWNLVVW